MTREEARDELIKGKAELESIVKFLFGPDAELEEKDSFDMAIEELSKEPCEDTISREAVWTPVSEPPKEDGEYLVTIELEVYKGINIVDKVMYSHNLYSIDEFYFAGKKRPGWYEYSSEYGYYEVTNPITAWMPLPEAYKQESEEA